MVEVCNLGNFKWVKKELFLELFGSWSYEKVLRWENVEITCTAHVHQAVEGRKQPYVIDSF